MAVRRDGVMAVKEHRFSENLPKARERRVLGDPEENRGAKEVGREEILCLGEELVSLEKVSGR